MAPYSALVPPILVAASVAYLRDLDAMGERLGHVRAAPPTRPPPQDGPARPGPKADPKGDGKGKRAAAKAKKEAAAALAAAQPQ